MSCIFKVLCNRIRRPNLICLNSMGLFFPFFPPPISFFFYFSLPPLSPKRRGGQMGGRQRESCKRGGKYLGAGLRRSTARRGQNCPWIAKGGGGSSALYAAAVTLLCPAFPGADPRSSARSRTRRDPVELRAAPLRSAPRGAAGVRRCGARSAPSSAGRARPRGAGQCRAACAGGQWNNCKKI